MKNKFIYAAALSLILIFAGNSYSQTPTIDLQIFEPLPQIDIGSILIQNNLQGVPKVFYVQINPPGISVSVNGVIYWDRKEGRGFEKLFEFTTSRFQSRSFYSDELGASGISILNSSSVSSLTEELMNRGMPTGTFKFALNLLNADGNIVSQTSREVTFSNPSQTLTVITPAANSMQSVGSVIARWSQINGASKYKIKLNVRSTAGQSLEDALDSGTPLINNKEVANTITNVDLRSYLEREWLPGQELVLQVAAVIEGIGGGAELKSEIVNFTIAQAGSSGADNNKNALLTLLAQFQNQNATQFASLLNEASMDEIKFYNNEGSEITFPQFQALINSILSSITKITLSNQ